MEIILEWLFGIPVVGEILRFVFLILSYGIGVLLLLVLVASAFGNSEKFKDYGRPDR